MEIKKKVLLRNVAGETLLIPVEESVKDYNGIFTLSATGALIFQILSEGGTEEDAAAALCREFEVSQTDAEADVHSFVDSLREFGIV